MGSTDAGANKNPLIFRQNTIQSAGLKTSDRHESGAVSRLHSDWSRSILVQYGLYQNRVDTVNIAPYTALTNREDNLKDLKKIPSRDLTWQINQNLLGGFSHPTRFPFH